VSKGSSYCEWAEGGRGGESETIIGRWLARRGRRDDVIIATKVGQAPGQEGLAATNIHAAAEASLNRLGLDHIDPYYAHEDDPTTPLEETLAAFDELVRAGKVRHLAASHYTAPRLAEALATSARAGLSSYVALQAHYNLVHRDEYEHDPASLCRREGLSCIAYSALADGFLTGKYRRGRDLSDSERVEDAAAYLNDNGLATLDALDLVAARHDVPLAAVALAWLFAQPTVAAAIASARTPEQLADLVKAPDLRLSDDDLAQLAAGLPVGEA
jgi:aryl-alcohol dehydrogenase (NADP+)